MRKHDRRCHGRLDHDNKNAALSAHFTVNRNMQMSSKSGRATGPISLEVKENPTTPGATSWDVSFGKEDNFHRPGEAESLGANTARSQEHIYVCATFGRHN